VDVFGCTNPICDCGRRLLYNATGLDNIGTYSSTAHCIAFFVSNNGEPIHNDDGAATGVADTQNGFNISFSNLF
jgi:hypothetical protein